jgi:hypothetical protein
VRIKPYSVDGRAGVDIAEEIDDSVDRAGGGTCGVLQSESAAQGQADQSEAVAIDTRVRACVIDRRADAGRVNAD